MKNFSRTDSSRQYSTKQRDEARRAERLAKTEIRPTFAVTENRTTQRYQGGTCASR